MKVGINGLGRIGRATLKIIQDTPGLELAAINDLISTANLAYLLKYDTVYGRFPGTVEPGDGALIINGKEIPVYSERNPAEIPWAENGVELVFESTGVFRTKEDVKKHLEAGARTVILSAPAKDDMTTVVHGASEVDPSEHIISCASCTTNSITPVAEVLDRHFGIEKAILTTIHAYTASQGIVDGPASKWRRGRAGAENFVPTSTGAAIATTKVLPQLQGRFDGIAVRGPIPVGSVSDLTFLLKQDVTVDQINDVFRQEAASERYDGVMGATDEEIVSSDIVGDPRACIIDLEMTTVVDGNMVKLLSWYDNEWGYSNQMVREALRFAQQKEGAAVS